MTRVFAKELRPQTINIFILTILEKKLKAIGISIKLQSLSTIF